MRLTPMVGRVLAFDLTQIYRVRAGVAEKRLETISTIQPRALKFRPHFSLRARPFFSYVFPASILRHSFHSTPHTFTRI